MSEPIDHQRIWDHFQTGGLHSFSRAAPRLRWLLARLGRASPGRRLLNIGIGDGTMERLALQEGWSVASLDPSEGATSAARAGLSGLGTYEAATGTCDRMPWSDGTFAAITCSEVIEHIAPDQGRASLAEIARVLAPGGLLVGTVPFAEDLRENEVACPGCGLVFNRWGHTRSFTPGELVDLVESAGLRRVSVTIRSFPDWRRRSPTGLAKSLANYLLGRAGAQLVSPKITFVYRRPG